VIARFDREGVELGLDKREYIFIDLALKLL